MSLRVEDEVERYEEEPHSRRDEGERGEGGVEREEEGEDVGGEGIEHPAESAASE